MRSSSLRGPAGGATGRRVRGGEGSSGARGLRCEGAGGSTWWGGGLVAEREVCGWARALAAREVRGSARREHAGCHVSAAGRAWSEHWKLTC